MTKQKFPAEKTQGNGKNVQNTEKTQEKNGLAWARMIRELSDVY